MPINNDSGISSRMMLKPINLPRDLQEPLTFWAQLTSVLDAQGAGSLTPTFTRATVATHVDATSGLVIRDATGVARFEANGYLAEGARTNICLYSEDFTNAAWVKSNMTAAYTSTGPDGVASTASRLTATAANGTALQAITSGSAARVTSMYVKRITGTENIDMTQDNGTTWATVTTTAAWTRVSIVAATAANPTVGIRIVADTDAIDVSFFDHEVGSFISSPIPTTSEAVTRNTDILTYPIVNNAVGATGTASVRVLFYANNGAAKNNFIVDLNSAGGTRVPVFWSGTDSNLRAYDGTAERNSALAMVANTSYGVASAWGGSTIDFARNGTLALGISFDGDMNVGTVIALGGDNTNRNISGDMKNLMIFSVKLPASDMASLTSRPQ